MFNLREQNTKEKEATATEYFLDGIKGQKVVGLQGIQRSPSLNIDSKSPAFGRCSEVFTMGTDRLERERVEGWDGVCELKTGTR